MKVDDLIAEARERFSHASGYVAMRELAIRLADALEAVSVRPLVADREAVAQGIRYNVYDSFDEVPERIAEWLFASGVIREAEPVAADWEAVREALDSVAFSGGGEELGTEERAVILEDAIEVVTGLIQSKGDAQAEALEDLVNDGRPKAFADHDWGIRESYIRARAAAYRTPASPNSGERDA